MYEQFAPGHCRLYHFNGREPGRAAVVLFPLQVQDDSGVAHVLEHLICKTICGGTSFADIGSLLHPDVQTNAVTHRDHVAFYFTCRSRKSYLDTLQLLLEALFERPLEPELFRQEAFDAEILAHGGSMNCSWRGVVFNEMRAEYFALDRQLDNLTIAASSQTGRVADPGGDPRRIARLRLEDVAAFRRRYFNPANCALLCWTPDDLEPTRQLLRAVACSTVEHLAATQAQPQPAAPSNVQYLPQNRGAPRYVRYLIPLGSSLDAESRVLAWWLRELQLELALIYQAFFRERCAQARYRPDLSGVRELNGIGHLVLTTEQEHVEQDAGPAVQRLLQLVLPRFSHLVNRSALVENECVNLREKMAPPDGVAPSVLLLFAQHLLHGREAPLECWWQEIESQARRYLDDEYASQRLSQFTERLVVRRVVFEPSRVTVAGLLRYEARAKAVLRRKSVSRIRAAAPAVRARMTTSFAEPFRDTHDEPEQRVETMGVRYLHSVVNLAALDQEQLSLLPMLFALFEDVSRRSDVLRIDTHLFSYVVDEEHDVLLASFKCKCTVESGWASDAFRTAWRSLLGQVAYHTVLDSTWLQRFEDALVRDTAAVALGLFPARPRYSAVVATAWRGSSQFELVRGWLQGDRPLLDLRVALARTVQALLLGETVDFAIDGGMSARDLVDAARVATRGRWPRRLGRLAMPPSGSRHTLQLSCNVQPTVAMRIPIPLENSTAMAACLALAPALDEGWCKPIFRDAQGAYHAAVNVDFALCELFAFVYRSPSVHRDLELLTPENLHQAVNQISQAAFEQGRRSVLYRLRSPGATLNAVVRDVYNSLLLVESRITGLRARIGELQWEEAKHALGTFVRASTPALSVVSTRGSSDGLVRDRSFA